MKTLYIIVLLFIGNSIESYSEIPFVWQNDTLSSNFVNFNDKLFMGLNRDYKGLSAGTYVNVDVNTGEINENLFLPKFEGITNSNNNSVIIIEKDDRLYTLDNNTFQIKEEIILPKLKDDNDPSTLRISIEATFNNISQNKYLLLRIKLDNFETFSTIDKTVIYDYVENKILKEFIIHSPGLIEPTQKQFAFSNDGTKFLHLYAHNWHNNDLGKLEIYSFPDFELLDELYSSERVGQAEYSEIRFFPTNNKILLRKDSIYNYTDEKSGKNLIGSAMLPNLDIYNLSTLELEEKLVKPVKFKNNNNFFDFYCILNDNILIFNYSEINYYKTSFYDISKKSSFEFHEFDNYSLSVLSIKLPNNLHYSYLYNGESEYGVIDFNSQLLNIENDLTNSQIILFPNPTTGLINLEFNSLSSENVNIEIVNELGEAMGIFKKQVFAGVNTLNYDITNYPKGIYFVRIKEQNITFKVVKE